MTMDFRNRSNLNVHVVVSNANVIYWHHNNLRSGESVHCPIWTPMGYDVRVFYDSGDNEVDAVRDTIVALLGYVVTGVGIWASIAGTVVAVASGGAATPAAIAGYGLTGVGLSMTAGSITLEALDGAVFNPATLPGLLGSDRYEIEIGGTGHVAATGSVGIANLRMDEISLRWKNLTAGHEHFQTVNDFRWVWQGDPVPHTALAITARPDGGMVCIGTDCDFWERADPGSNWVKMDTARYVFDNKLIGHEEIEPVYAAASNICALPDGRLFASFARPRDVTDGPHAHGCFLEGGTWRRDASFDNVTFVGELPGGFYYIKDSVLRRAENGSAPSDKDLVLTASATSLARADDNEAVLTFSGGNLEHFDIANAQDKVQTERVAGDNRRMLSIARLNEEEYVAVGTDHRVYFAQVRDLTEAYRG